MIKVFTYRLCIEQTPVIPVNTANVECKQFANVSVLTITHSDILTK